MALKTLRICLFKELPDVAERDINYLYLTYDRLLLFFGQNPFYDPFVICERVPESPIEGCLYIQFDGSVKTVVDGQVVDIAKIEDESQTEGLKKLGTTYFIHADRRYLDLQRRTLQLPYHNGTYSMTVSLANDLKVNDKTVVRYDQASENFYIEGEHDSIPRFDGYTAGESGTVDLNIEEHCIHADVRVSKAEDNMIQVKNGGLYATTSNKVSLEQFNQLRQSFEDYQTQSQELLSSIQDLLDHDCSNVVSENSIMSMVVNAVSQYNEDITYIVQYYNSIYERLESLESKSKEYTDKVFEEKSEDIAEAISHSVLENVWGEL
jgi:hypothetical protein